MALIVLQMYGAQGQVKHVGGLRARSSMWEARGQVKHVGGSGPGQACGRPGARSSMWEARGQVKHVGGSGPGQACGRPGARSSMWEARGQVKHVGGPGPTWNRAPFHNYPYCIKYQNFEVLSALRAIFLHFDWKEVRQWPDRQDRFRWPCTSSLG